MKSLIEDTRSELLNKSKHGEDYKDQRFGKNRYQRRVRSKIAGSVKEFNSINMNEFFKNNILNVGIKVIGETNSYVVSLSFGGVLDEIQEQLKKNNDELNFKVIARALIISFNKDNVYISCSCDDWKYRMAYWATRNDINSGEPQLVASDITNPDDKKGKGCKHSLLVLSNNTFLNKIASVIYNYINYMKNHYQKMYADIIYPAIYGKDYDDDVQLSFDDSDELDTSSSTIDVSNKEAKNRNQFKKGNQSGMQFASKDNDKKQFDFDSVLSDEEKE